jgi:predicted transcriptional regulator
MPTAKEIRKKITDRQSRIFESSVSSYLSSAANDEDRKSRIAEIAKKRENNQVKIDELVKAALEAEGLTEVNYASIIDIETIRVFVKYGIGTSE